MVELALNLAWTIIAAASYALLLRRLATRGPEHACGPNRVQCIIALTCFLAILFPVISLTDDLHEMQATAEEACPCGALIKRCVASLSSTPAQTFHSIPFLFAPYPTNPTWVAVGRVADQLIRLATPDLQLSMPGRAPPSSAPYRIS